MPQLPLNSKEDLNKKFWENIHFGREVVWYGYELDDKECGKELNQFRPPNSTDDLCLIFYLYPSSVNKIHIFVSTNISGRSIWIVHICWAGAIDPLLLILLLLTPGFSLLFICCH